MRQTNVCLNRVFKFYVTRELYTIGCLTRCKCQMSESAITLIKYISQMDFMKNFLSALLYSISI